MLLLFNLALEALAKPTKNKKKKRKEYVQIGEEIKMILPDDMTLYTPNL